jgi:hypothetical protein
MKYCVFRTNKCRCIVAAYPAESRFSSDIGELFIGGLLIEMVEADLDYPITVGGSCKICSAPAAPASPEQGTGKD